MQAVLVGLSGGVDSAVAALILKEKGYSVIGATMAIWGDRKTQGITKKSHKNACFGPDEKEDIELARKIASKLDIPYYVFDCAKQYEEIVLKYFKSQYLTGKTPNPCIYCNAFVKFGVLPHIAKLNGVEFDKFATGHYARVIEQNGRYLLKRAIDKSKDQTYFLYKLTQNQLKDIILPLGEYNKSEIRKIALDNNLPVADKPDSQDFYDGSYAELLNVADKKGNIVDTDGNILAQHNGIWNYTIGQRKGLNVYAKEPVYVLELNKDKNEVVVGSVDKTFKKGVIASELNIIADDIFLNKVDYSVKIRSSQQGVGAKVEKIESNKIKVTFDDYQKSPAVGQAIVLYDNDTLVAGGIIEDTY